MEFMKTRTEWVGTATELIADMAETETTPNVVTKYLGQFYYEVLEPAGIEYRTKRTGQSRLINSYAVTAVTQMTGISRYSEMPVTAVIAVTNKGKD